ncbi:MAG: PEP-CTERM sorting domain-containing protein [Myxococcota bacterium]
MSRAVRSGIIVWVLVFLAGSSSATIVRGFLPSSGLVEGFGYADCPSCTPVYSLLAPAPIGANSNIAFSNDLVQPTEMVSFTLVGVHSVFGSGLDTVSFSPVQYFGSANATVSPLGGGLLLQQVGSGSATLVVHYSATLGGNASPVVLNVDVNDLSCTLTAAGDGSCDVSFGPGGFAVNDGSQALLFTHTFHLVTPEPSVLALLGLALGGLAVARARRG